MRAPVQPSADATARLAALAARRAGALAAAAAMPPLALARVLDPAAPAGAMAAGAVPWAGRRVVGQALVEEWALRDELAEVPAVARYRSWLVAPERRRE